MLTKPDRIPYGDENIWISLIKNEDRPLKNNWFCVKQPGAKELAERPGWKQARAQEAEYFSSTAHWTELDPLYQEYLRTENLTIRLSGLLSDLIAKRSVSQYRFEHIKYSLKKTMVRLPEIQK